MTASKPARQPLPRSVEEHFGKLELPVKEAVRRGDSFGLRQTSRDRRRRQCAPPVTRHSTARRTPMAGSARSGEPLRAPQVGDALPLRQRRCRARSSAASARSFARTCSGVSFGSAPGESHRQRVAQRDRSWWRSSKSGGPPRRRASRRRVARPGRHESQAPSRLSPALKMVIEKAERPVGGKRRQPERQPRQLHGHGLRSTPYRHRSATIRRMPARSAGRGRSRGSRPRGRARPRMRAPETAGADQKRAAAHRGIEHLEAQDLFGRGVAHERRERAADQIVRDRLRRVERAGGLSAQSPARGEPQAAGALRAAGALACSRAAFRTPRRAARPQDRDRRSARGLPVVGWPDATAPARPAAPLRRRGRGDRRAACATARTAAR